MQHNDSRRYPSRPFAGIGALVFENGRVLLVERGQEPLKGWWSLPGGILETGERLEEGVRREVREETGLDVEVLGLFEVFERILPDSGGRTEYHYVLLDYLCRPAGGKLRPASDASRVMWVSRDELGDYRITEGTRAVVERAFGHIESQKSGHATYQR